MNTCVIHKNKYFCDLHHVNFHIWIDLHNLLLKLEMIIVTI